MTLEEVKIKFAVAESWNLGQWEYTSVDERFGKRTMSIVFGGGQFSECMRLPYCIDCLNFMCRTCTIGVRYQTTIVKQTCSNRSAIFSSWPSQEWLWTVRSEPFFRNPTNEKAPATIPAIPIPMAVSRFMPTHGQIPTSASVKDTGTV